MDALNFSTADRLPRSALPCLLTFALACSSELAPKPEPTFTVGEAQYLSVSVESEVKGGIGIAAAASSKRYSLRGTAELLPMATGASGTRVRLHLVKLELQASDADEQAALARLAPLLTEPAAFTLRNGVAEDLRVSERMQLQAYGWLRTLVSALQWPERVEPGHAEIEEEDATGRYRAKVELSGTDLRKVKTRYLTLIAQGIGAASLNALPTVTHSEHRRSPARGPFQRIGVTETLRTPLSNGKQLDVTTRVSITALPRSAGLKVPAAELQKAEQSLSALVGFLPPTPREGAFDAQRIAQATLDQVLQEIVRLDQPPTGADAGVGGDATGAYLERFSLIAAMLRQRPSDVERVGALIRSGHARTPMLLQALASAGTEQTQALLRTFATEGGESEQARSLAATSLLRVTQPAESTVELLTLWANDPQMEEHGLYGLGTAARRLRERGHPQRAEAIAEILEKALRDAKESGRVERVLRGIANSADGRLFDQVRLRAADGHAGIRTAAIDALRFMEHPGVDGLLLARARLEEDTGALRALLSTLSARKPSKELAQAIVELAAGRQRYGVRFAAIEQAGKWLGERPELRALLERAERSDEREEVRELALGLLTPAGKDRP